tara:strand:+ start:1075 stop:1662 length:588 start_codon:yes stop_codon:yes gene_type:complete
MTWYDKIVLMEIDSFTQRDQPCFVSDRHLSEFVGIAQRTVRKSLAHLVELGLVERSGFDGRKRYLCSLLPSNPARAADLSGTEFLSDRHVLPKKKTNTQTKEQILYPWDCEEFRSVWATWKTDRAERRIKKYTQRGEQAALHKLQAESGGDMAAAIAAINNSIANGYQGIFFDRKSKKRVDPGFDHQALNDWASQ